MSTASTSVDGRWAGGLRAAGRLLVLLGCRADEAADVRRGWVGQAVDVEHRADLAAMLYLAGRVAPDVIVLGTIDDGLPPADFLRALRQVDQATPVLAGARQHDPAARRALEAAGATVIVALPLAAAPLLTAVARALGECPAFHAKPMVLDLGRLRIDGAGPRIWVDDVQCVIPPMEFLLLRYLAERHGQIISRMELVSAAWQEPVDRHSNSLSVHVARLRRRFCDITGEAWIRPVRGFGYQLTVPAARVRRRPGTPSRLR